MNLDCACGQENRTTPVPFSLNEISARYSEERLQHAVELIGALQRSEVRNTGQEYRASTRDGAREIFGMFESDEFVALADDD